MKNFFVILGGMGTLATTGFLNEMNKIHKAEKDQGYLNYLLFNHADVPDRTDYILGRSKDSPVNYLLEDIRQADRMDPDFYVIACNTAHYFYDDLQKATDKPIINMPELVLEELNKLGQNSPIGLFATQGTIESGLYRRIIEKSPCRLINHRKDLQDQVNKLIYQEVKAGGNQGLKHYHEILREFMDLGAERIILGCTELSYLNSMDNEMDYPVIDAEGLLIKKTVERARKEQNK